MLVPIFQGTLRLQIQSSEATSNKGHRYERSIRTLLIVAPGLTTSNKKLLETSASLLVTSALLLVTRSYSMSVSFRATAFESHSFRGPLDRLYRESPAFSAGHRPKGLRFLRSLWRGRWRNKDDNDTKRPGFSEMMDSAGNYL